MGKWRNHNLQSKWVTALDKLSRDWLRDGMTEAEVFDRRSRMLNEGRSNTKFQRKIIYNSDKEAGRLANRIAYAKYAEQRRLDARLTRLRIQGNPELRIKRNSRDSIRWHKRLQNDIGYRLYRKLKNRILVALKKNYKASSTKDLLGCSIQECRRHIESKWQDGMSWDNHTKNGWHIDHIIPCCDFDLSDPEQQRKCFHYTNLQPLWCLDNWKKGAKAETESRTYKKR